jgi:hypothetical protein
VKATTEEHGVELPFPLNFAKETWEQRSFKAH